MQPVLFYGDEVVLVEVTDSFLENFLADLEGALDVIRSALIAKWGEAIVVFEPLQKGVGKVLGLTSAGWLKRNVYLAIWTDVLDIAFQSVTGLNMLEDLVAIDEPLIFVVDDDLEAEVGLLPYEERDRPLPQLLPFREWSVVTIA